MQRHKDGAAILTHLLHPDDRALVVPIPEHRCWSVADLAQACPQLAPCLEAAADPRSGLEQLMAPACAEPAEAELCPVVAGSLHLLGAVIPWLDPPRCG